MRAKRLASETRRPSYMDDADAIRRRSFESLALSGLWLLMRFVVMKPSRRDAMMWRADVLGYMDEHGRQGPEPKAYRREKTFPEIPDI